MIRDLVLKNRSYRRFDEQIAIPRTELESLVDLARLSGAAANRQPLKYFLAHHPAVNERIFPCLAWAGYLKEWPGPAAGERPTGYIVMVLDTLISEVPGFDGGIAAQSILLGAVELGLGGCMIGNVKWDELRKVLGIEERYKPILVIALGKPGEKVVIETAVRGVDADIKYWRDREQLHHVPKRELAEVLLN